MLNDKKPKKSRFTHMGFVVYILRNITIFHKFIKWDDRVSQYSIWAQITITKVW